MVEVIHVVEPVGGMQGRVLREGVAPAQEVAGGARVSGGPVAARAAASLAASLARGATQARAPRQPASRDAPD